MDKLTNSTKLKHWSVVINEIIDFQNNLDTAKANDADVVKLIGNQTIGGNKTFENTIVVTTDTPLESVANEVATAKYVLAKLPKKLSELTNDLAYQTKTQVDTAIANIVGSAPETLDTLNELAAALGNDPNFATTISNQIGTKANASEVVKLTGNQTIAGTKTFSTAIAGSITGNAATATKLATARTINGTSFSGTANITTTKWGTARTISLSGDVAGSASIDGSANADIEVTLANSGATAGAYGPTAAATLAFGGSVNIPQLTVDAKGRITKGVHYAIKLPAAPTSVSGNAGSATKLATARTINGVSFNGTANITHFGTCSTAAATVAKVVSLTGFTLATGAEVTVQFTVTNTAASPTLNVNNTGAKPIVYRNAAISAGYLAANRVYKFVYDGTNYELIGDISTTSSDTKVTQTVTTTAAEYALLATATASPTATKTEGARFSSGITINPSTNALTAAGPITGSAVYNAVWNDYAEFFPRGEETEPGDIIALDTKSDEERYIKAYDISRVVGVHSDTFGHLIGGEKPENGEDFVKYNIKNFIPVGLAGRVRTKVIGEVKKGDYIVVSHIPGIGRAYQPDIDSVLDVIGIACENKTDKKVQRILMKIK